jgi:hypothetical protein
VDGVIADAANGSAWTFGASILSFAFPMILFVAVIVTLYVLYTKPEVVPGHPAPAVQRPVSYTALPGKPAATSEAPAPAAETTGTAETPGTVPGETTAGEAAGTEDAE